MSILLFLVRVYRRVRAQKRMGAAVVVGLVLISIFGNAVTFYVFEGGEKVSFGDALWYSMISIATIGYGDYAAQTLGGRLGTVFFIILIGLAAFTAFLSMTIDWTTRLTMQGEHGMGEITAANHVLIVNFPSLSRVRRLVEELQSEQAGDDREIVVISNQIEALPFESPNVLFVQGSPLERETYERARIGEAAMAIVLATGYADSSSDAVVASAVAVIESLRPDIRTVAECVDDKHLVLFKSVRCNAIIHGTRITDNLLVQEGHDPGVSRMIDALTTNRQGSAMCSVEVSDPPPSVSYNELAKALIDRDVHVIAVNRGDQTLTPFGNLRPEAGDQVIYMASERIEWAELARGV